MQLAQDMRGVVHDLGNGLTAIIATVQSIKRLTKDKEATYFCDTLESNCFTLQRLSIRVSECVDRKKLPEDYVLEAYIETSNRLIDKLSNISAIRGYFENAPEETLPYDFDYFEAVCKSMRLILKSLILNEMEYVSLGELLNLAAVREVKLYIPGGKVYRKYDTAIPLVFMDGGKIFRVFLNLVRNAREAVKDRKEKTGEDEKISIRIKINAAAGVLAASINNNLTVMPQDSVNAFNTDGEILSSKREGVGRGLRIARDLGKRIKASIIAKAAPGEGTTFTVELPLVYGEERPRAAQERFNDERQRELQCSI